MPHVICTMFISCAGIVISPSTTVIYSKPRANATSQTVIISAARKGDRELDSEIDTIRVDTETDQSIAATTPAAPAAAKAGKPAFTAAAPFVNLGIALDALLIAEVWSGTLGEASVGEATVPFGGATVGVCRTE